MSRLKDNWYGITYPAPLQAEWLWRLWARFMCVRGWHLLDEYSSISNHALLCDACDLNIPISPSDTKG